MANRHDKRVFLVCLAGKEAESHVDKGSWRHLGNVRIARLS